MDRAGHEGGVLHHVGKNDQLSGTVALNVGGAASGFEHGFGHEQDGVHVDARARRSDVYRGTDARRGGQRLGDGCDESAVGVAKALVDQRREATQKVDAQRLGRAVKCVGQRGQVLRRGTCRNLRDWRDGNALVGNGDAVLALQVLGHGHQVFGLARDAVVDLLAHAIQVLVCAAIERDAHRDGAQVKVLLADHGEGFGDFLWSNVHARPLGMRLSCERRGAGAACVRCRGVGAACVRCRGPGAVVVWRQRLAFGGRPAARVSRLLYLSNNDKRGKLRGNVAEKVTLKTIAREVGLSPATVSLVLNGRPVRVSDENRRRILDVARREHYIPNQIARSLVTQHTQTLGLIVPNIESRFFSSFAKMLEMKCRRRGYALFITNSDNSTSNDADLVRLLVNRGADGIFIITSDEVEASKQLIADLEQLPVPYVMVDRTIDALDCDKVTFNNELGGYLATKYLLDHGHRRIACMVNTASNTGCARLNGYVRALGEKGLELDQSLVLTSDYYIPDAYLAAQQLIRVNATAVVATSDNIALGLLRYLYERGLHVPRDYSVVGYDNSISDALFEPALTSIEQNVDELSDAALSIMFRRLGEHGADVVQRTATQSAATQEAATGKNNGIEAQDDSASIQIILEPRMIEKNSVRVLTC